MPDPQDAAVTFIYTITGEFLDENGQPCTSEASKYTYTQPAKIIVAPPVTAPLPTTPPNNPDKPEDICGKLTINGKKITISDESTPVPFKKEILKIEVTASTSEKEKKVDAIYEKLITEVENILICLNQKREIYFVLNTRIREKLRTELKLPTQQPASEDAFWNPVEKLREKFKNKLDMLDEQCDKQLLIKILKPVGQIDSAEPVLQATFDLLTLLHQNPFPLKTPSATKKDQLNPIISSLLRLCKSYEIDKSKLEEDYVKFHINETNKQYIELKKKIDAGEAKLQSLNKGEDSKLYEWEKSQIELNKRLLDKYKSLLETLKPDIKACLISWLQQLKSHALYQKSAEPTPNGIEIEIAKLEFVYEQLGISKDVPPETSPVDTGDR